MTGAAVRVVEGDPPRSVTGYSKAGAAHGRVPVIDVQGGRTQGQALDQSWESSDWRSCGPTVLADLNPDNTLMVGMHDLLTYSPVYDQVVSQQKTGTPQRRKLGL